MAGPDDLAQYATGGDNPLPPDLAQYAAAQGDNAKERDQFAEDRAVTDAWAEKHPFLGPIARFTVHAGQNAADAITKTPGNIYHAVVDPSTLDEAGLTPEQRFVYRMGGKQAIEAAQDYAGGKVSPKAAVSVLPEALGTGVGQVAGGAVYGKLGEIAPEVAGGAGNAVRTTLRRITPKQVAQGTGAATGAGLGHGALSIPGAYYGAKGAGSLAERILGKEFANKPIGLPSRVTGGPAVAPPFEEPPIAPEPSFLDATAENKPFAGGEDEWQPPATSFPRGRARYPGAPYPAAPTPEQLNPSLISPARTLPGQISPEVIRPPAPPVRPIGPRGRLMLPPGPQAAAAPAVSPMDAQIESAVSPTPAAEAPPAAPAVPANPVPSNLDQMLRANMERLQQEAPAAEPEPAPYIAPGRELRIGNRAVAPTTDLTEALTASVPVKASAAPAELLKRWGVDEKSFSEGREQTRGMKPGESAAAIARLTKAYKGGKPVEPVVEYRDAENNITEVDGRGRALAASRAGVKRIPIIVRRAQPPSVVE